MDHVADYQRLRPPVNKAYYNWRFRKHVPRPWTDIGRMAEVEPEPVEEYVPVEKWTVTDCITAVLRRNPDGLTAHEIAERIGAPPGHVSQTLSGGRNTIYRKAGARVGETGRPQTVWVLGDVSQPVRAGNPNSLPNRIDALLRDSPGLTSNEIAERLGANRKAVRDVLWSGQRANRFRVVGAKPSHHKRGRSLNVWESTAEKQK